MNTTSQPATAVVLDVVGSRSYENQRELLGYVAHVVEECLVIDGRATSAAQSIGDELQAIYTQQSMGHVLTDVARLRLSLVHDGRSAVGRPVQIRCGLGGGSMGDAEAGAGAPGQSGSAWWNARRAIEHVDRRRKGWPQLRWWYVAEADAEASSIQASLVAMDTFFGQFDDKDVFAAARLLDGASAAEVAGLLDVGPSAMSRRLHGHCVYGLLRTLEVLRGDHDG